MPVARRRGARRRERQLRLRIAGPLLLVVVLAVQAALSVRLVRADTAFDDEAMSLWAGHLEWAHWLHGTSIPPFPKYFSGAPVIYPPLGALADSLGGLAAARVLSLLFMLGATALLWGTAAAVWAAGCVVRCRVVRCTGPDAASGGVRDLDALRVVLVALASWCVVRAGDRGAGTGWMIAAGAALALANAAAYSSVLFDLVVLALALLVAWPAGGRVAARRAATLLIPWWRCYAGVLIGGSAYLGGFERTTLARAPGASPPLSVLANSCVLGWPDRGPGGVRL